NEEVFVEEVAEKLNRTLIARLVADANERPPQYESTLDNIRRSRLLAEYARQVVRIGYHGKVRQMAALTSFCLPRRPPTDPIWGEFYPGTAGDSRFYYEYQSLTAERRSLEEHAHVEGCRLIIDNAEMLPTAHQN